MKAAGRGGGPADGAPGSRPERVLEGLRQIAEEDGMEVRIAGGCMAPALAPGDRVRVRPARFYWPGDLVVVRSAEGRLLAHRLLGLRPWHGRLAWVTQGDACATPDTPIPTRQILGRIEGQHPTFADRLRAAGRLFRRMARPLR